MILASRLHNVTFRTSKDVTSEDPINTPVGQWSICYSSSESLGDSFIVRCTNNSSPITRMFSISAINVLAIELREVEIYGYGE